MPEIRRFLGIIIRMCLDDYLPPHLQAIYGEYEAQISINPIGVLQGELPHRAQSMVIEWIALHQQELMDNWEQLSSGQPLKKIGP